MTETASLRNVGATPPGAVPPGRIVWWELATPTPERSLEFHLALFPSWQSAVVGGQHRITLQGVSIGDVHLTEGNIARWIPFVATLDLEETCSQILEAGGAIITPPPDIPNIGRFVLAKDPEGSVFAPITLITSPPEHSGPMPAGAFCFHELRSIRPAEAIAFYTRVFGWSASSIPMGTEEYTLFRRGSRDAGGMLHLAADSTSRPGWIAYVYTNDVEGTLKAGAQQGGTVDRPTEHVPGVGQRASLVSPDGATIALFQSERG